MENYSELHNICIKVFESVAGATTVFILPLFLGKIVFSNILGDGSKVGAALKGALVYFALIAGFPIILEILFSIPEAYLPKFDSINNLKANSSDFEASVIPFFLDRIIEVILACLYWVVYYMHVFFMILMCSMAPVIFLLSTILGVGLGLEIFMGLLVIGSTWPIIWYGFDQVHLNLVKAQDDAFGAKCLELLMTLFKGLAPVSFASLAINSPAGKALTGAAKGGMAIAKWTRGVAKGPSSSQNFRSSGSNVLHKGRVGQKLSKGKTNPTAHANFDRLKRARNFGNTKGANSENSQTRNS